MKKGIIAFTLTALVVSMVASTVVAAQSPLEPYKTMFSEKAGVMLDYSKRFHSFARGKDPVECQIAMNLRNIAFMNHERLVTLCDFLSICEAVSDKEELLVRPIIKKKVDMYIENIQNEIEQVGTALRCANLPGGPDSAKRLREELQGVEKMLKSLDCGV